jgi:hypothetical protein
MNHRDKVPFIFMKNDIEMDLQEIGHKGAGWFHLPKDTIQRQAILNTIIKALVIFLNSSATFRF